MPRRERNDQVALNPRGRADYDDQAAVRTATKRGYRASVSLGSRRLTGLSSTPIGAAKVWRTAHCPIPTGLFSAFRTTPTREICGATSLSSSSHFTLRPYSNWVKPGQVAARPRQTFDNAAAHGIDALGKHNRHGAGQLSQDWRSWTVAATITSGLSATSSAVFRRRRA
jgi:hypothetical protein